MLRNEQSWGVAPFLYWKLTQSTTMGPRREDPPTAMSPVP
jgi:hypothetical protein